MPKTLYWSCDCGNGPAAGDENLAQDGALRCHCGRPLSGDPKHRPRPTPNLGEDELKFKIGDRVVKDSGDYTFEGIVVSRFHKMSGIERYVVEDDRGLLFIFNEASLKIADEAQAADRLILYREALERIAGMTDVEADFDGFDARQIASTALSRK